MTPADNPGEWVTGYWIETISGRRIDPVMPDPRQIDIGDIAHALANQCRFTGHVSSFFSVAQHSVLVSLIVDEEYALEGLLHDASEAYLSDLARPVKVQPAFKAVYGVAEERLMFVIAEVFALHWPIPKEVKVADEALLRAEARDLLPNSSGWWREGGDPWPEPVVPVDPVEARRMFLARYAQLTTRFPA